MARSDSLGLRGRSAKHFSGARGSGARRWRGLEPLEPRVLLATFTVNSLTDAPDINPGDGVAADGSGVTTLRAAIMEANALAGRDTINLPAGTINFTIEGGNEDQAQSGDLDILEAVDIIGLDPDSSVIDAGGLDRVFDVFADATFRNVQIAGGFGDGGGIRVINGDVTVSGSVLAGNTALDSGGGIANVGDGTTVTVQNSTLFDNNTGSSGMGGGVFNTASLVVIDSVIDSNSAGFGGGGIANGGSATISSTTFSNNNGAFGGGGVYVDGGTTQITNSTFSFNNVFGSGGGVRVGTNGSATVTNSTIVGNFADQAGGGAAVDQGATLSLANTIIAGNGSELGGPDLSGIVQSLGNNLIGVSDGNNGIADGENDDIVGTVNAPVDPMLGPLQDNGGLTPTHEPQPGSPAIDSGNDQLAPAVDQRGAARPFDGDGDMIAVSDRGAVEASSPVAVTFFVTNTDDSGQGSLRQAILNANAAEAPAVIVFNIGPQDENFVDVDSDLPGGDGAADAFVISPLTPLPLILGNDLGVQIDGQTQGAFSGDTNPFGPEVVIDGLNVTDTSIGGLDVRADNVVISGLNIRNFARPNSAGIRGFQDNLLVSGNYIGTDATGTAAMGNAFGLFLGVTNSVIGGTAAGAGNLISGNVGRGLALLSGADGNRVEGNLIGTDRTGTVAVGNGVGVDLEGTPSQNVIGGIVPGARNIVSGNTSSGFLVFGTGPADNVIQGNFIGTDITGTQPLGNGASGGVRVFSSATGTLIGSDGDGSNDGLEGNLIAHNAGPGVEVDGVASGTTVRRNRIFDNGGLGIDLTPSGVTANDAGDTDTGPNALQNFPVISSADAGAQRVQGVLNSTPNSTFVVDFYVNSAADASGFGEGEQWIGSTLVSTDGAGDGVIDVTLESAFTDGQFITATATNTATGDTSEFSAAFEVGRQQQDETPPTAAADATNVTAATALHAFTVTYADNVAIDVSTIGGPDVRVTGPGGFDQPALLVNVSDETDGSPRVATYLVQGPGNGFTSASNGAYTIVMQPQQVADTSGNFVPAGPIGGFAVIISGGDTGGPDTTPPAAGLIATDLNTAGGATHQFQVQYTDNAAVNVSTLDGLDVRVTAPGVAGGFNQLARFVGVSAGTDGSPRFATYEIDAPGGTWGMEDEGAYTVSVEPQQVADTSDNFVPAGAIGQFNVAIRDTTPPSATLNAATLTTAGAATYSFDVTYSDEERVNTATLDNLDVRVVGDGVDLPAVLVAVSDPTSGSPRTATYRINAPGSGGGLFDAADNGTYSVVMQPGQVTDFAGNAVPAGPIGMFDVAIVDDAAPTAELDATDVLALGSATHTFDVIVSDDAAVDAGSFDAQDIEVLGPNGETLPAVLVGVTPAGNGTPRVATYRIDAVSGSWNPGDNGVYTVVVQADQITDTAGNAVEAGAIGAFNVAVLDNRGPSASLRVVIPGPAGPGLGPAFVDLIVTYSDNARVDAASLGAADLLVTGPDGVAANPALMSVEPSGNQSVLTATYRLSAPNGAFRPGDNGTYSVALQANQVLDINDNAADPAVLGSFAINVNDVTPPGAQAPPTTVTNPGGTMHTFDVTYTDDDAVDQDTLTDGDVIVTGPNAYTQPGVIVDVSPSDDGSVVTVTYVVPAPGGTWDESDNGTYTIELQPDEIADVNGNATPPGVVGEFVVNVNDVTPPTASLAVDDITVGPGPATHMLTVTYLDDGAVDPATLGAGDITITGPGGFVGGATLVSVSDSVPGTPRVATYELAGPGGAFDPADDGVYTVTLNASQVFDTGGNPAVGQTLGAFTVALGGAPSVETVGGELVIVGTDGDDTIVVTGDGDGNVRVVIDRGDGRGRIDRMFEGVDDVTIIGEDGDDQIMVGDNVRDTGRGLIDVVIDGGDGDDNVIGGQGDDTVTVGRGEDTVVGGGGDDTVRAVGDLVILGTPAGGRTMTVDGQLIVLDAGVESVFIDFTAGAPGITQTVIANQSFEVGGVTVAGGGGPGSGDDTLQVVDNLASVQRVAVTPTAVVVTGPNEQTIGHAGLTSITVDAAAGDDVLDVIFGPGLPADVTVDAGGDAGDALTIAGTDGDDVLTIAAGSVGDGSTTVTHTGVPAGNLTVAGGDGDDFFVLNDGWTEAVLDEADAAGNDTLDLRNLTGNLAIVIGSITVTDAQGNTAFHPDNNIENILGGPGDDTIRFSDQAMLGDGTGVLDAGGGNDVIDYRDYTTPVTADLDTGTGTGLGSFTNVEDLVGVPPGTQTQVNAEVSQVGDAGGGPIIRVGFKGNGSQIDASTFDSGDITVTGPGGVTLPVRFIGTDLAGDGTVREAIYQVQPPPGGFTEQLNGSYQVVINPNQVFDTDGQPATPGPVGNVVVNVAGDAPTAQALADDLTRPAATHSFRVLYRDDGQVNLNTLDNNDLLVTIPGAAGFAQFATFVSAQRSGDGTVTATYRIVAPAGVFGFPDSERYTVQVQPNQVLDNDGNPAAPGDIGTFRIKVSPAQTPAALSDLSGAIAGSRLGDTLRPGDRGSIDFTVTNNGPGESARTISIQVFASLGDQTLGEGDVPVGGLTNRPLRLGVGDARTFTVPVTLPHDLPPGDYFLIAVADTDDASVEGDESNNVAALGQPVTTVNQFGDIPGMPGATSRLTLAAADGTLVTFTLAGPGMGTVTRTDNGFDVLLEGTDGSTRVTMLTRGGRGATADLNNVVVNGSIRTFNARRMNLLGNMDVSGTASNIAFNDVADQHQITIGAGGPNDAVSLSFGRVSELSIVSQTPIRSIRATEWLDADDKPDVIQAPWVGSVVITGSRDSDGDFGAAFDLSGQGAPRLTLTRLMVAGDATDGQSTITGDAGRINIRGRAVDWDLTVNSELLSLRVGEAVDMDVTVDGAIRSINADQWSTGSLTAGSVNALRVIGRRAGPSPAAAGLPGDLGITLRLVGEPGETQTLGRTNVSGELTGTWHIEQGDAGPVSAGSVADEFSATVAGELRRLSTAGAFRGTLAAAAFGSVRIGGTMSNATLLAGADLGDDAALGGAGAAADAFGPGSIARLFVRGSVIDSVIGAGLDPVNGILNDGDDAVVGAAASSIGPIVVTGPLGNGSLIAAGAFGPVRVDGSLIDPATDGRFLLG